jgi:hypothetical protein
MGSCIRVSLSLCLPFPGPLPPALPSGDQSSLSQPHCIWPEAQELGTTKEGFRKACGCLDTPNIASRTWFEIFNPTWNHWTHLTTGPFCRVLHSRICHHIWDSRPEARDSPPSPNSLALPIYMSNSLISFLKISRTYPLCPSLLSFPRFSDWSWTGKVAQWVKHVPHKPGNLSLIPWIHVKVGVENPLHKIVLWPPRVCCVMRSPSLTRRHTDTNLIKSCFMWASWHFHPLSISIALWEWSELFLQGPANTSLPRACPTLDQVCTYCWPPQMPVLTRAPHKAKVHHFLCSHSAGLVVSRGSYTSAVGSTVWGGSGTFG